MSQTKVTDAVRDVTAVDAAKLTGSIDAARVPEAAVTQHVTPYDPAQLEMNQALLAFKIAASNQLAKFQMVDQVIDEYQDATGIDAGASTNELAGGATTAKYYGGGSTVTPTTSSVGSVASTGTVAGDYTYYKWTTVGSSHSFTTDTAQDYEYLVVAGGGSGGGSQYSGGGGAGGYRTATGFAVAAGTISGITVGDGGASATNAVGNNGGDSSFSTITSTGGGGGGRYHPSTVDVRAGKAGGSGGGGGRDSGPGGSSIWQIPSTEGSVIGDFTSNAANAFNDTSESRAAGAQRSANVDCYIGKDLGSGNEKKITGASWECPSDGDSVASASSITFYLYASNSAPSSYNNGTLLGTIGTEVNGVTGTVTSKLDFANTTAYRYVWIHGQINGGAVSIHCSEVRFYYDGTPAQGYAGGAASAVGSTTGGSGGSASQAGHAGASDSGSSSQQRTTGVSNSITGSAVVYANGGVGTGGHGNDPFAVTSTANLGDGGAAAIVNNGTSFAGGSGIVVIRRLTTVEVAGGDLTLQSTATTAAAAPTTGDLVILIDDGGSGTSAVQTNIKGFISRNGNFNTLDTDHKQVTFVDEGTWGTTKQKILVARNVDLSGITTGTSMKYRLTTHSQSAGTMETRIHATSLAWA